MAELSDDDLVRLYCDGDADAFDVLFDRHYLRVYHFARMMLQDDGAAEEALQEAFLAVVQTARRYQPTGRFVTWLMRIVRNHCLNRLAALRRQKTLLRQAGLIGRQEPRGEADPLRQAEDSETMAAVRAAISLLPDRQREAIVLYAFGRMKYQQIAEVLEVPVNTVKTLINRARAALAAATQARTMGERA